MKIQWKKWLVRCLVLLLLAGAGAGAYWYWWWPHDTAPGEPVKKDIDRVFEVKRGELVLGLSQSGSVTSRKKHALAMEANVQTKLVWIIAENTPVKEGELLAEFETENIRNRIDELNIEHDNLEKELLLEEESNKIKERSDAADKQAAADRVALAKEAIRKYRSFEYRKSRDDFDLAIKSAEDKYSKAKRDYEDLVNGSNDDSNADDDEQARKKLEQQQLTSQVEVQNTKNSLNNARNNLKVFKRYDHPNNLRKKQSEEEQAVLQFDRVSTSSESNRIQAQRRVENYKMRMKNNRVEFKKFSEYLEKMKLFAPADGIVLYGDSSGTRFRNQPDIKLGMDIGRGMVLLTIPDMSNLVVDFDLAEMYRSRVNEGDRVVVTPDSVPGLKVEGKIESIATLPVNISFWDPNSAKVYKSRVVLDQQDPGLVNGMSVKIEIVTGILKDILYIPVEAVFEDKDRMFVYRQNVFGGIAEVDIKIGASNDTYVQILEGLEEGDNVCLYRPFQAADKK